MNSDSFALTSMQEGMVFHHAANGHSGVDVIQLVIEYNEPVDVSILEKAWQAVVHEYPMLRTAFRWQGLPAPIQDVHEDATLEFNRHSIWNKSALPAFLEADRVRGFDLARPPLMRLAFFGSGLGPSSLVWTYHHALIDGRAVVTILNRVEELYQTISSGRPVRHPPERSFKPYVDWVRQLDHAGADEFWKSKLKGFAAPTPLPHEPHGPPSDAGVHGEVEVRLAESLTARLRDVAQQYRVTLNVIFMGVWAIVLSRFSGEADVVFAATKSTRARSIVEADSIVGLFLNTIPIRIAVNPATRAAEMLKQLRAEWRGLQKYEHLPLVQIKKAGELPVSAPLFESLVVFENQRFDTTLADTGPQWRNRGFRWLEKTNFGLAFHGYGDPAMTLKIDYDPARFHQDTVKRILAFAVCAFESIAANPDQTIGTLPIIPREERNKILVEWNRTESAYPKEQCLHELIEEQSAHTPDAIAVVFESEAISYRRLNERSNQLARHLQSLGVGPDKLVAICMDRSIEMVVGLLGILKAGGAYVPLDPEYPKDRLAFILEDAQATVLLTQRNQLESLPDHQAQVVAMDADSAAISRHEDSSLSNAARAENLAYVIYTSGSTGRPKGVQISHWALVNFLTSMRRSPGFDSSDVLIALTTLSFDIAGLEIWLPLTIGARVVIASRAIARDGRQLAELFERSSATVVQATPSTWQMLFSAGWKGSPALKILCGGEPWSRELSRQLLDRCGSLWNMYGPTETTIWSAACKVEADGAVLIGNPIANTQFYVLDAQMQPAPIGVLGELCIGGDGLARGYVNRPELTSERFLRNPFMDDANARIYRTGDLVRSRPDGKIEFVGRADHQVKIRGFRIELGEIESLLSQHPDVQSSVVMVHQHMPGDVRLAAYVVSRGGELNAQALRDHLRRKLPEYMIPAAFVAMDAFPLTPNGKVDRKALPAPQIGPSAIDAGFVAPRTPTEKLLAEIWADTLRLENVGVQDDFFEIGGHSLSALQLLARVEEKLGKRVSVAAFIKSPTVERLANLLDVADDTVLSANSATLRSGNGGMPLTLFYYLDSSQKIARYFESTRPVHFIGSTFDEELREWEESGQLNMSMGELARRCVVDLKAIQPRGPYLLAGFCVAGVLAMEVALQLEQQGEQIALVGLLDSFYFHGLNTSQLPRWLARWSFHAQQIFRQGPGYVGKKLRDRKRSKADHNPRGEHLVVYEERVRPFWAEIVNQYRCSPYSGDAVLLRAIGGSAATFDNASGNGWQGVVQGSMSVEDFECTHEELFDDRHAPTVARTLERYLSQADRNARRRPEANVQIR